MIKQMMRSRTSNSFLISVIFHTLFIAMFFLMKPGMRQIGNDFIFERRVEVIDGAEAARIREWLDQIKAQRLLEGISEISEGDLSLRIREQLVKKLDIKDTPVVKKPEISESHNVAKLGDMLKEKFAIADNKPYLSEVREFKARVGNGILRVESSPNGGVAVPVKGDGGSGDGERSSGRIQLAFMIDESPNRMVLQDDPIFIRKGSAGIGAVDKETLAKGANGKKGTRIINQGKHAQIKIIGELGNRTVLSHEMPNIPVTEMVQGKRIRVKVRITVLGNGRIKDDLVLEETSGYDFIDDYILEVLTKWVFEPLPKEYRWQEQIGVISYEINFI